MFIEIDKIVGQENIKQTIRVLLQSSHEQEKAFPHCILIGPSGSGKTLIASAIYKSTYKSKDSKIYKINAATVKSEVQLTSLLCDLVDYDVIFMDEVHRLSVKIQESLYTAMENGYVNITDGFNIQEYLVPKFTLIGATTHSLAQPMLDRFNYKFEMEDYNDDEIAEILQKEADFDPKMIAPYARSNPRIAKNIINWIKEYCYVHKVKATPTVILDCFKHIGVHVMGLTNQDIQYLELLKKSSKPVGLQTICAYLNLSPELVQYKIEPFLLKKRLIMRLSNGRILNKANQKLWDFTLSR